MNALRLLLCLILATLAAYTAVVGARHGFDLLPVFFGDMAELGWPGQFNLDFLCFLVLSALWVAWRHRFRAAGLLLAVVALVGGSLFLSVYLLVESRRSRDLAALLLGERAAR